MKLNTMAVLAALAALASTALADTKTASFRSAVKSGDGSISYPSTYGSNGVGFGIGFSGSHVQSGSVTVIWTVNYVSNNSSTNPPSSAVTYSGKYTDTASASVGLFTVGSSGSARGDGPSGSSASAAVIGSFGQVPTNTSGPYYYYTGTINDTVTWTWNFTIWSAQSDVATDVFTAGATISSGGFSDFAGSGASVWWALVP